MYASGVASRTVAYSRHKIISCSVVALIRVVAIFGEGGSLLANIQVPDDV